jgi:hypothetical protein
MFEVQIFHPTSPSIKADPCIIPLARLVLANRHILLAICPGVVMILLFVAAPQVTSGLPVRIAFLHGTSSCPHCPHSAQSHIAHRRISAEEGDQYRQCSTGIINVICNLKKSFPLFDSGIALFRRKLDNLYDDAITDCPLRGERSVVNNTQRRGVLFI